MVVSSFSGRTAGGATDDTAFVRCFWIWNDDDVAATAVVFLADARFIGPVLSGTEWARNENIHGGPFLQGKPPLDKRKRIAMRLSS